MLASRIKPATKNSTSNESIFSRVTTSKAISLTFPGCSQRFQTDRKLGGKTCSITEVRPFSFFTYQYPSQLWLHHSSQSPPPWAGGRRAGGRGWYWCWGWGRTGPRWCRSASPSVSQPRTPSGSYFSCARWTPPWTLFVSQVVTNA